MWNLKTKLIEMNLFTKGKLVYRLQKQTYGCQRGKVGGDINQEFGTNICTFL